MSAPLETSSGDDPGGGSRCPLGARAVLMDAILPSLPGDVQQALKAQLLGPKASTINFEDALITLQLVLAKMQAKELQPRHLAWPSLAACIALLADMSPETLKARTECGFSHRELYWALEQDMLGYNSGKGAARRFARCLPCAVGKPGKCGSGSAAWFCRRRLSIFDTRSILLADKSQALLTCGNTLLPSRSDGSALARGLTASGEPEGLSRKCKCAPVGPEENKFVSCYDHVTWNDKRLQGVATEDDKSETFVAQARTLLDTLEGMAPSEQWQEVNIAATKRYIGSLKRLSGKDSNKRKMTVRADGEVFPLTKEDLKTTELKRWPDFDFFIGGNEPDDCLLEDLQKRSACFLNDATRAWAAEMQPTVCSMPPWHIRSGRRLKQGSSGPPPKRQRTGTPRALGKSGSKSSSSAADELSTASLRIPSVTGGRLQLLAEAQPGGPRPSTPELSLSGSLLRARHPNEAAASSALGPEAALQRQRSPSVPSTLHPARSGGSNVLLTPPSPTHSSKSTRKASVSSLHGRGTAASDLLTSLVSPPQGGRSGPLHAGLLQDPSQLSSAFAGSFPSNASDRFGSSGRQHQMPDWRLPAEFNLTSSGGTGPRVPSLDRPLSGAGPVSSGWGCFGAGSLSTAGPANDGRQPAPRRASMRVDLAASDTADMLPRMGCPAGVSREECCPPLAIASLRTRGPPPPMAGGLGPFPSGSLHGGLSQVHQRVARHGSMLDLGGAGSFGSGANAPTARSRLASTGFGSMTDLPSARFGGDWSLGATGASGNGFAGASAGTGAQQFDRLSAWRRDTDLGGAGPSSAGAGPGRSADEAGPSSGAGPSRGGPTTTTPADDSAIFDGYLDDLLSFDELLMPMDGGFDAGGRPDSHGGAGPSTGGHSGGALGEDLGGFCSNCWGKEEGCPECQRFLEELLMPSSPTKANPAAFAA